MLIFTLTPISWPLLSECGTVYPHSPKGAIGSDTGHKRNTTAACQGQKPDTHQMLIFTLTPISVGILDCGVWFSAFGRGEGSLSYSMRGPAVPELLL